MSKRETYEQRVWDLLLPILEELRMVPVDVEFVKEGGEYYLRCYIDKDGGVGVDDCEAVSRMLDPVLDKEDFIGEAYTLEVSSPGLGRPLKRPRDFEFAKGKEIELRTYRAVDGKKEFRGILEKWDKNSVTVRLTESGAEASFSKGDLSLIRLAFDF